MWRGSKKVGKYTIIPSASYGMGWGCRGVWPLSHSQLEGLVELGRPAVVLGFGGELALLVGQEGADHADLHEGPEHPRRLPLHVVHCDDCTEQRGSGSMTV